jgi:DNA-binding HxlR family transcriptional regulator
VPKLKDESIKYRILMLLASGEKRFTDLLSEIKRATLSSELRKLEGSKLIKRSVDNKARPPGVMYSITDKGRQVLAEKAVNIIKVMDDTATLLRTVSGRGVETKNITDRADPLAKSIVNGMIATNLIKQ